MEEILKIIGSNIARYRKRNGSTQAELGRALGIKGSMVSYIEKGQRKLGVDKFVEIAGLLGVGPLDLLRPAGGAGEDPSGEAPGPVTPDDLYRYARDIASAKQLCGENEDLRAFLPLVGTGEALLEKVRQLSEDHREMAHRIDRLSELLRDLSGEGRP